MRVVEIFIGTFKECAERSLREGIEQIAGPYRY